MPDYTRVNLLEVEDVAPRFGFAPNLQSRFARTPLGLENSGLSLFRIAPNFRMPFGHHHAEQEEIYVVLSGSARVRVQDDVVDLRAWDAIRIAPGATHGLESGDEGADVLAFGAPNTDNKDVEMIQGWWK
jgi:mannose-6-phosphate isomerase-like protein (cupin superfamily)